MEKAIDTQLTLSWNELAKHIEEAQKNNAFLSQFPPEQRGKVVKELLDRMEVIHRKIANGEKLADEERNLYLNAQTLLTGASAEILTTEEQQKRQLILANI